MNLLNIKFKPKFKKNSVPTFANPNFKKIMSRKNFSESCFKIFAEILAEVLPQQYSEIIHVLSDKRIF